MTGPYAKRKVVVQDASVNPHVRQAISDLASQQDLNEVLAPVQDDIGRVCFPKETRVVRLQSNSVYHTGSITITTPVELIVPESTTIQPYTGTGKVTVNVPAVSGVQQVLTIRGGTWKVPVECLSRVHLIGLKLDTASTTTHGAKIEIDGANASRSIVENCESDNANALGILVRSTSIDVRVTDCDFSLHTTAVDVTAAATPRVDNCPGLVVVH